VNIYSDYPFPSRRGGEAADDFEVAALNQLKRDPTQPVYEFTNVDGRPVVRYVVADVMQESCVSCHNNHPDSPKTDWQVGDVRGALALTLPMGGAMQMMRRGMWSTALIVGAIATIAGGSQWFVARRSRRTLDSMEQHVFERTAALSAANLKLERGIQERIMTENRLTSVLNTVGEGIMTLTPEGKIAMSNSRANRIWGYNDGELDGRYFQSIVVEAWQPFEQYKTKFETMHGKAFCLERTGVHKNRKTFPVEIQLTRTAIEDQLYLTIAVRDITKRKRMEYALQHERTQLAQRVDERTVELQKVNAQLERAARMKDEFFASMSHELRTPLNAILGLSQALTSDAYGELSPVHARPIQLINESGQHLLDLINDILDVSKIEAGKFQLTKERVHVPSICTTSVSMIKQAAQDKQIEVVSQCDPEVVFLEADALRLKQILVNLLSNAVKFTPEKGNVSLRVRGDAAGKVVYFIVSDTGIGISTADIERLFEPFIQLDSRLARQYNGSGLGLALVERLTKLHGGRVSVKSEEGKGSQFVIALPWVTESDGQTETGIDWLVTSAESSAEIAVVAAETTPPLVLLAEDNDINIATLYDFLEYRGCNIIIAHDGVEAIAKATEHLPDLILMDVQMPNMDGLEATRRLRQDQRTVNIPIIALTGLAMSGDRERCLAAGASDYLSKPFQLDDLITTMDAQLALAGHGGLQSM
jgi:PAS domain S-box-containing protein